MTKIIIRLIKDGERVIGFIVWFITQVRHPNLLLLIGAVFTTEGEGPLIVTELLDWSLRSAYEGRSLEERSKVPVL